MSPFPLLLGVGNGVADGLGQPGACCPGNSPAPPLLIGCHDGRQPRFKGTPAIALLKTYQSHCGWRNKRSFSYFSSPGLFLPRWRGERVALFLGAWGLPHQGAYNKMTTSGALPPLSLGQLESQGPHNFLILGQARGLMVVEADPSSPSPQEYRGENSILKYGHQAMHTVLSGIITSNEELRLGDESLWENMGESWEIPRWAPSGPQSPSLCPRGGGLECLGKHRDRSQYLQQAS